MALRPFQVSGLASLTLLWLGIVNKFPLLSLCATFKFQVSGLNGLTAVSSFKFQVSGLNGLRPFHVSGLKFQDFTLYTLHYTFYLITPLVSCNGSGGGCRLRGASCGFPRIRSRNPRRNRPASRLRMRGYGCRRGRGTSGRG